MLKRRRAGTVCRFYCIAFRFPIEPLLFRKNIYHSKASEEYLVIGGLNGPVFYPPGGTGPSAQMFIQALEKEERKIEASENENSIRENPMLSIETSPIDAQEVNDIVTVRVANAFWVIEMKDDQAS